MSNSPAPTAGSADRGLDRELLAVASVVVLGAIMSILDTTVVNVAINALSRDFDSPLSTIQWVVTRYTLALATVIPVTGWAADRFGTKRLYMISIALFLAGSALCGIAWSAESLIGFRVLQGLGGGMIMPAGMTILTRAAGQNRVGRVMSVIGVPMLLGPILGPILGGWLVDDISWRWIFLINIPIGIAALAASARILPRDTAAPHHRLDLFGLLLLSPGLGALIYGLAESSSTGGFGNAQALVPFLAGLALLAVFVWHALRDGDPLIDLRLFANRDFAAASGTMLLFAVAVFGSMLLLPLYFQAVRGESALSSGLLLAPQGLGAMVMMPIAGQLTDRIGVGRIVLPGLGLVLLSMLALAQLGAQTSYWITGAELFVFGLGIGATMMPIMFGAMRSLRRAVIARGSTVLNIIQQVGASIGTAVMSVLLTNALTDRLPAGGSGGSPGDAQNLPAQVRDQIAPLMADAFGETFYWGMGLLCLAGLAALLLPRKLPEPVVEARDEDEVEAPVLIGV